MVCNLLQILTHIGSDVPTISELRDHVMHAVAPEWKNLGIKLGSIQFVRLETIDRNHYGDSEECCIAMFRHWLGVDKTASWDKLIAALESMKYLELADKIKEMTSKGCVRRYIHSST